MNRLSQAESENEAAWQHSELCCDMHLVSTSHRFRSASFVPMARSSRSVLTANCWQLVDEASFRTGVDRSVSWDIGAHGGMLAEVTEYVITYFDLQDDDTVWNTGI